MSKAMTAVQVTAAEDLPVGVRPRFMEDANVRLRVTRTPNRRQRRLTFGKGLGDRDFPGGGLLDLGFVAGEAIGPLGLVLIVAGLLVALVVLLPIIIVFLLASVELAFVGIAAMGASIWAWLRGHPKYALLEVDGLRWTRLIDDLEDPTGDRYRAVAGADPAHLGYCLGRDEEVPLEITSG